jgi:arylsulfatase A-like enzyme
MTGKHPARLHLTDYIPGSPFPHARLVTPKMAPCLPLEEITLAEKFKENGYATGHFGKWHLSVDKNYKPGRKFDPESQGFDDILTTVKPKPDTDPDSDAHHSKEITKRSLEFLDKYKNNAFFLYTSYHTVHRPLMENAELIAKYENKPGSELPENNPIMGAMIETMDIGIGQILQKLEELNLVDNTIVVFYSDNGGLEMLQDQKPLRGSKATIFEGGIRVPLAVRWPGVIKPGSKSEALVATEDLFPTLMEATGISYDNTNLDGVSLMPVFTGEGQYQRNEVYVHYPHYHHQGYKPGGVIRVGDYKLIEWYEETMYDEKGQINLYNLKDDIGEENDLASEMPDLAAKLRDQLHAWRVQVSAQEMTVNDNYNAEKADYRYQDKK